MGRDIEKVRSKSGRERRHSVPLPFRLADCAIINAGKMRFDRNSLYLPSRQSRLQFCVCQRRFHVRLRPPFAFASKLLPRGQAKNIFSHRVTFIDFMKLLSDSEHVLHCHQFCHKASQ